MSAPFILACGDVVMTERVDHFLVGNNRISVPCMGTFEVRNGKIAPWLDYWDLKQFEAQLPGSVRADRCRGVRVSGDLGGWIGINS